MFFNDVYNKNNEILAESVVADEFNVEMYAEEMTGELSDMYEVIMESDAEFFNLQEKMMKLEHCAIVTENAMLLEEGKENFGKKILEKMKNMWEKVKAFLRKVKEWFLNIVQNDKKFLAKHGDALKKAGSIDFEYGVGAITAGNVPALVSDMANRVKSGVDNESNKGSVKDLAAQKLLGVNESEMKKALEDAAKKGAGKVTGAQLFELISGFKKDKAELDKLERECDQFFKVVIAKIKSEATYTKDTTGEKDNSAGKQIQVANVYANTVSKYIGICTDLLKKRKMAARSAAVRLVKGGGSEEPKNALIVKEGFEFGNYENVLDMF